MPNDLVVQQIVQRALDMYQNELPNVPRKVGFALTWVMAQRNAHNQCGEEWACADHYLHARYFVGSSNWPIATGVITQFLAGGYNLLKIIGLGPLLREGNCPESPASYQAYAWAETGVQDGLADRSRRLSAERLVAPLPAYTGRLTSFPMVRP